MPDTATAPPPFEDAEGIVDVAALKEAVQDSGISIADLARAAGYHSIGGYQLARRVLGADAKANPTAQLLRDTFLEMRSTTLPTGEKTATAEAGVGT